LAADQIGCQFRQSTGLIVRPAKFNRDVLAVDLAVSFNPLRNAVIRRSFDSEKPPWRKPMVGSLPCCARAASGHAAAAPPSVAKNFRRAM